MTDNLAPWHGEIAKGIGLHAIRTDRFKTARLSLFMMEEAHKIRSPLGTLLLGVLQRGCEGYPSLLDLNRRLDHLYGTALSLRNFLHGDRHVMGFTADMLDGDFLPCHDGGSDILGGTLDVMSRMWLRPLLDGDGCFRRDIVESEKKNLCDCILSDRKDPRVYSLNRLRHLQCEGEPYGLSLMGTVEQIQALTAEDVTQEWQRRTRECAADVVYIGSEPLERLCGAWNEYFSQWTPTRLPVKITRPHIRPARMRRVEEVWPVSQGRLNIGWQSDVAALDRSNHRRDYDAAMVLCELFGIMQGNLLFANVRERMGLCYECDASWEADKGVLTVSMGVSPSCGEKAEGEVFRLINEIQNGHLDKKTVELAKMSLSNGYRQIQDNAGAMEAFWFRRLHERETDTPEICRERLAQVSREDVIRAARRLTPDVVYALKGTDAGDEGEVIP